MTGTVDSTGRGHPISVGVSRIEDELKTLRDQPAWSMGPAETRDVMVRLTRLTAAVAELQARVAGHGRTVEVEADSGATSTANWWAHATRQTRTTAHRKTKLATALGAGRFEPVRVALAEGRLLVDQAEVIITAVQALPADLDPEIAVDALVTLVGYAEHHDATALR
ncbi:MAG TPA: HNH endonuclease, partial [Nocardioides sp.]|nr:HNH endonuclease [Nocardioides sp.]